MPGGFKKKRRGTPARGPDAATPSGKGRGGDDGPDAHDGRANTQAGHYERKAESTLKTPPKILRWW
mgnify:CR=1 FL=1